MENGIQIEIIDIKHQKCCYKPIRFLKTRLILEECISLFEIIRMILNTRIYPFVFGKN